MENLLKEKTIFIFVCHKNSPLCSEGLANLFKMKFQNSIVAVTGAGQGIGRAIALAYSSEGATLLLIDKNERALLQIEDQIIKAGHKAAVFQLDLVNTTAIKEAFSEIDRSMGKIDILINNAGLGITKSIDDLTIDEWDYVINANLRGTFFMR
jgi:NAD(P)-dependent dehydrogenase (short-subunit alcohol dehydrogenase family)